jgi:hypothetical protein
MELKRFHNIEEAREWYLLAAQSPPKGCDAVYLAICEGDEVLAESLYRSIEYRNRWWAELAYMQGHYLIRLRRRDCLVQLVRSAGVQFQLPRLTDDPCADIRSIGELVAEMAIAHLGDREMAATLRCMLGHAYLAMDYHELAVVEYRRALVTDAGVKVLWENNLLLESCRAAVFVERNQTHVSS